MLKSPVLSAVFVSFYKCYLEWFYASEDRCSIQLSYGRTSFSLFGGSNFLPIEFDTSCGDVNRWSYHKCPATLAASRGVRQRKLEHQL
jgi:hypothetical protein